MAVSKDDGLDWAEKRQMLYDREVETSRIQSVASQALSSLKREVKGARWRESQGLV